MRGAASAWPQAANTCPFLQRAKEAKRSTVEVKVRHPPPLGSQARHLGRVNHMTTISQIIGQSQHNAGSVAPAGGGAPHQEHYDYGSKQYSHGSSGSRVNDGYSSLGGSVLRNAAIGAATGAIIGMPTGIGIPIGAGIGAAVGAGSALIRHPRVAGAVGDGMKGMMAGAAGGALVGVVTPFGPVGGAVAGAAGGFLTGTVSGMLKNVAGGRFSIEKETTLWGRVSKGFALGAVSGATVGAGAGLMFGGIGALPGALWGAAIGGVGGAIYGATTGLTDAATGAKGVSFTGNGGGHGGSGGFKLPSLSGLKDKLTSIGDSHDDHHPDQWGKPQHWSPGQSVTQCRTLAS